MQSNTEPVIVEWTPDSHPVNSPVKIWGRKKSGKSTLMLNKIKRAQARAKEERFLQEPPLNQNIMLVGRRHPGKAIMLSEMLAIEKAAKKAAYLKLLKNKIDELESQQKPKENVQKVSIGQANIVSANILWPLYVK
jgi:hypothetical protein